MTNYSRNLEWDPKGRCKYRVAKKRKCEGTPGLSGGCSGYYTDDYGTRASCNQCSGNGIIRYWKWIRVPEFDSPRPKDDWVPDWVED